MVYRLEGQDARASYIQPVEQLCTNSEAAEHIAVQHRPALASLGAIVLTNHSVILFRGKTLGRMRFFDISWYDVKNIHLSEGILGASLIVTGVNGHRETIDHLLKEQARSIYRVGRNANKKCARSGG
ncbi:MAG: hypothetical protein F9B45_10805 [Phycisphaera sp. RhM]|nr:hypothetical protein [Phycisphaera sp. RhM]